MQMARYRLAIMRQFLWLRRQCHFEGRRQRKRRNGNMAAIDNSLANPPKRPAWREPSSDLPGGPVCGFTSLLVWGRLVPEARSLCQAPSGCAALLSQPHRTSRHAHKRWISRAVVGPVKGSAGRLAGSDSVG